VSKVDIKFEPDNRHVRVTVGTTILEAAKVAGVSISVPCGGNGVCGKCRCRVISGQTNGTAAAGGSLSAQEIAAGWRLACQTAVDSDAVVYLPPDVRMARTAILEDSELSGPECAGGAATRKVCVELPAPSLADQRDDLTRLCDLLAASGNAVSDMDAAAVLPAISRACRVEAFRVTGTLHGATLIGVEAGDKADQCYGIAVDLGTTTIVAYLVHLPTRKRLAVASEINPQVAYGDDVATRISYVLGSEGGLAVLRDAARGAVTDLVHSLCNEAGVSSRHVYELRLVGNATMVHLVLGADPRAIPLAPYIPAVHRAVSAPARDIGFTDLAPGARFVSLANIAGWVGADTVGVILSTAMHQGEGVRLAIDIGTNGEIVAGGADRLVACSTAAGPAFEGAQIRHGMRGALGAIDHVTLEADDLRVTTIGDAPARGICGTGLIDAAAALVRAGIVLETGRMMGPNVDAVKHLPKTLRERLVEVDGSPAVVLASRDECAGEGPIVLTQRDIRQLQLAKGAIAAGVQIALATLGADVTEVREVLLAGAFGSFVTPASAAGIGLFPTELEARARAVGNAAGAGALCALLSADAAEQARLIGDTVEYLELAGRPDFDTIFADQMLFPQYRP
jgi:uncharacterized 2Fe-2S/4Fe-4S cluster protein (DUF4445 family)